MTPLSPSARITPATTKRARSLAPVPPFSSTAPPPDPPLEQHVGEPLPPDPRSVGFVIEPYVAFAGTVADSPPTPPYDADASAPPVVVPPSVMPMFELLREELSSRNTQPPR